jgi:choline dehydrogenase-like flavoprotein
MDSHTFDAIVVGSGITGGWAAKELTERGLKVLMLERGRDVEHVAGYPNALKGPWEVPHRGRVPTDLRDAYPKLRRHPALNESNLEFWASDRDHPYVETQPFEWYRGYQVGGRSLTWGRQSYRWCEDDFEANAREGLAVDWPIRYRDLAPWYDRVERFIGVSGSRENLPQLPDGEFLPPMEMNVVERHLAARIHERYQDTRRLIIGRAANLTAPIEGRANCQFRNKCWLGCTFGAYFSTQSSTLPAARRTGLLTLRPHSIVTQVLYDKDRRRARGVEVLDAQTRQTTEYRAKIVFLCASAFNSTWILFRSATDVWPGGLGSSCGELGHNVMDHHTRAGAGGRMEGFEDRVVVGNRPNSVYVPRYRNLRGERRPYLRGFGLQGRAGRQNWQRGLSLPGIGASFKDALREPGPWTVGLAGFGEILPHHDNRISLDPVVRDAWGLPVLAMDCTMRENEERMRREMADDAAEMLAAAGAVDVKPNLGPNVFGRGIHEMGTARMGRDRRTSVLNANNQVWDAPNVFVTDGACMTSASCVNPSLTYMALTARAAAHAVEELNRQNL